MAGPEGETQVPAVKALVLWKERYARATAHNDAAALREIGVEMFGWVNTGNALDSWLREPERHLQILPDDASAPDLANALIEAPWEVLHHDSFLAEHPSQLFVVSRRVWGHPGASVWTRRSHRRAWASWQLVVHGGVDLDVRLGRPSAEFMRRASSLVSTRGSRSSRTSAARRSQIARARVDAASRTPPPEVMRPPSKTARTFLPDTLEKDGKSEAVSVMAVGQFLSGGKEGSHNHFFTLNQSIMPPPSAELRVPVNNPGKARASRTKTALFSVTP